MQQLKWFMCALMIKFFSLFPIEKDKIVFCSYRGKKYDDNPRLISEMVEKTGKCKIVWLLPKAMPEARKICTVKNGTIRALYEVATAKVWVDNCRKAIWLTKRKGQFYIQTWHAGISLKRVEKEAGDALPESYIQSAINDSKMADLFLSPCKWCTQKYRDAFWYEGEILEGGLPRSDIFFTDPQGHYEKVCKHYGKPLGVRYALYAPTFRVDHSTDCYCIDYKRLKYTLEKYWGGEWKILVRLHPNVQKNQNFMVYDDNVLNGSAYEEINELIMASDLLITDYSSCSFDAMLASKKVILFATDIDAYNQDRGTYFSLDELPFPLTENNDQLMQTVERFDEDTYKKDVEAFKKEMQMFDDGHATERVVERILQVINSDK